MDLSACGNVISITGLLSSIYLLFLALYYFWAKITNNNEEMAKFKAEITEFAFSLFWVVSAFFIFSTLSMIFFPGYDNPVQPVVNALGNELYKAAKVYADLKNSRFTYLVFFLQRYRIFYSGVFVSLYQTLYGVLEKHRVLVLTMYQYLNLLATVYISFDYISRTSCLLPIGIVLRLFPPTKKIGNVFLALFVSVYYFFPYVFHLIYTGSLPDVNFSFLNDASIDAACIDINQPFPSAIGDNIQVSLIQGGINRAINSYSAAMSFIYLTLFPSVLLTLAFFRYFSNLLGTPPYLFTSLLRKMI